MSPSWALSLVENARHGKVLRTGLRTGFANHFEFTPDSQAAATTVYILAPLEAISLECQVRIRSSSALAPCDAKGRIQFMSNEQIGS
jgi:hypothetical protein